MLLIIYYCLFMLIPYIIDIKEEMTQHRHLIEMGYDYAVPPFLLERIFEEVKRYSYYFCPFVNIFSILELFDGKYKRFDKKDVKKMLSRGEIVPISNNPIVDEEILEVIASRKFDMPFQVAELTKESLVLQAYAIKLMNKSDSLNLKENWRDFSTDRKIEIILGILQDLYADKAFEMGVDLNKELEDCEENLEKDSEKPAKKLKNK